MSERTNFSTHFRELLSNTVESDMQTDEEREYLRKYKNTLQDLKREQRELSKIKRSIAELSAQEGTAGSAAIDDLEESAQDISTLIYHYKNYLLKLERTPPLSNVIERESVKAYRKQKEQKVKEFLERYEVKRQETLRRYNEQRHETLRNEDPTTESPIRVPNGEGTKSNVAPNGLNYVLFAMLLMSLSLTLPLAMLDAPFGIILVETIVIFFPCILMFVPPLKKFTLISYVINWHLYNVIRPILYVWALVVTIGGKQDFFAIAFYVLFALQSINIIKRLIGTIGVFTIRR